MPAKKVSATNAGLLFIIAILIVSLVFVDKARPSGTSLLFIQNAESGTLRPANPEEGTHTLTLLNPDPQVSFYANRPGTDAGSMTAQDLFEFLFEPGFALPNGALVINQGPDQRQLTLELEFISGTFNRDGSISYIVRSLVELGEDFPNLETGQLGEIELFLDSGDVDRCSVHLFNQTSQILTLESLDPSSDSWAWGTHPYNTVEDTTIWVFRYKKYTGTHSATVTYRIDDAKTMLEVDLHCGTGELLPLVTSADPTKVRITAETTETPTISISL